jgi:hypothetical protein
MYKRGEKAFMSIQASEESALGLDPGTGILSSMKIFSLSEPSIAQVERKMTK